MERAVVGLLGLGTVGSGVARLLIEQVDRVARRSGKTVEVKSVLVRDPDRSRSVPIARERIVTNARKILDDPELSVDSGSDGRHPSDPGDPPGSPGEGARTSLRPTRRCWPSMGPSFSPRPAAMVGPISVRGQRRRAESRSSRRSASAWPRIRSSRLAAIVNGTCNFILTAMTRRRTPLRPGTGQGPGVGLRRGRPDPRRRRHRHRSQAGGPRPACLRRERDHPGDPPARNRPALARRYRLCGRAWAIPSNFWLWPSSHRVGLELRVAPTLVRRGNSIGGRRRDRITRSGSWATPWATRSVLWARGRVDADGLRRGGRYH